MKRTFLAMLMAGSSMAMFAQTTPTTPTTTPTNPTTSPTTPTTTEPTTTSPTDPTNTTTNSQINTTTNSADMSTSWEPGTSPYWGWNSYGIWNSGTTNNTTMNNTTNMNNGTTNANMSSTGSYSAYSGTAVSGLPMNVQSRFNQDFPMSANNTYSWSQYGDWFHTQYMSKGRSMHYFYNSRGDGYALALPVIQTYVPEDIIDKALNKYGANLYSIAMVTAADSGNTYQLGLIDRGQLRMVYLNDAGTTVQNVWRVEDTTGDMNATDANAEMGTQSSTTTSDMSTTTDVNANNESQDSKIKYKENGVKTKIKSGDGKVKIKQKKVDD